MALLSAWAAALLLGLWQAASAHCTGNPPVEKITNPEPGTAIVETCYPSFGTCFVDTFHSAALLERLVDKYRANKHAVFARVQGLENHLTADTVYYRGQ